MSIRFLRSFGLAVLLTCFTVIAVSAKGGYSFITISGADIAQPIRTNESALTEDFFAFADFYRDRVEAPANTGVGYEITRYYMDGGREIAFDRLHYYPSTGYVYYDGIVNGSSEYDRKWYAAAPGVKSVFEHALTAATAILSEPVEPAKDAVSEPVVSASPANLAPDRRLLFLSIAITAGFAVVIVIVASRRKTSSQ